MEAFALNRSNIDPRQICAADDRSRKLLGIQRNRSVPIGGCCAPIWPLARPPPDGRLFHLYRICCRNFTQGQKGAAHFGLLAHAQASTDTRPDYIDALMDTARCPAVSDVRCELVLEFGCGPFKLICSSLLLFQAQHLKLALTKA